MKLSLALISFNLSCRGIHVVKRLTAAAGNSVSFAGGTTRKVSTVIWATAYHDDSTWVDIQEIIEVIFLKSLLIPAVSG